MSAHFQVGQNFGRGQQWKYYYLYGLERTGRLSGVRFFGDHDWYREGAEELVHDQDKLEGSWRGTQYERYKPVISTSFALLFLAKGRSPVVINKLRNMARGPTGTTTSTTSGTSSGPSPRLEPPAHLAGRRPQRREGRGHAPGPDRLLQRPRGPRPHPRGEQNLRDFVDQGGFIFAEACCGRKEFDRGFRDLMKRVFPDPDLRPPPARGRPRRLAGEMAARPPGHIRSGGSSTGAGPSSSTRPTTSRATGTRSRPSPTCLG